MLLVFLSSSKLCFAATASWSLDTNHLAALKSASETALLLGMNENDILLYFIELVKI